MTEKIDYLEKYKSYVGDGTDPVRVLGGLSMLDYLVYDRTAQAGGEVPKEDHAPILEFMNYFVDRYRDDPDLFDLIDSFWTDLPRVLQIGEGLRDRNTLTDFQKLPAEKQNAEVRLTDYIRKIPSDRELILYYYDEQMEDYFQAEMSLKARFVPEREQLLAKLHEAFLHDDSVLVIRYATAEDGPVASAIRIDDWQLTCLSEEEAAEYLEELEQEDGREEEYLIADLP